MTCALDGVVRGLSWEESSFLKRPYVGKSNNHDVFFVLWSFSRKAHAQSLILMLCLVFFSQV